MPTFVIFKAGRETKRIRGADVRALDKAVRELAEEAKGLSGAVEGSAGGGGEVLGGDGWLGAGLPRGYTDVTSQVDVRSLDFLNLSSEAGDSRAIFSTSRPASLGKGKTPAAADSKKDWIESDTDEQLMLYMPFQSTMKLHSLHITSLPSPSEDEDAPSRPKTLQLYTNRSHVLGFDEAEDAPVTQRIELDEDSWDAQTGTAKIELRFVKFQNISSLVVFVVESEGDSEKTRVDRIRLVGESGEKKSMGKLEKIGNYALKEIWPTTQSIAVV
ncbi:Thioredoxin-like protein 1 [Oleoguttula sp. CCFEE 5521]